MQFSLRGAKAHSTLRRFALLRRDDPAWPECLTKLDTIPVQFGVQAYLDSHVVMDFREFVEGGCVGVYGINNPGSHTPRRDQNGELPSQRFAVETQVMAGSALAAYSGYQRRSREVQR